MRLADFEMRMWRWIGQQRYKCALERKYKARGRSSIEAGEHFHIRGAQAEYACSLMLNLYCRPSIGEIDQPDVGGCIEVRSTSSYKRDLTVDQDGADYPWVLIQVGGHCADEFDFIGWMMASEAKQYPLVDYYGNQVHGVPRGKLYGIDSLQQWVRAYRGT